MSLAKKMDITVNHGDHYFLDLDGLVAWTGHDIWFTAKGAEDVRTDDNDAVIKKRYDPDGVLTNGMTLEASPDGVANARAIIALTPADTQTAVQVGVNYVYDVQVKTPDGKIFTPYEGVFRVAKRQVTWAN